MSTEKTDTGFTLESIEAGGKLPNADEGIKAVAQLVREASEITLTSLTLPEGAPGGLPASIPIVIDRRPGGKVHDLRDIIERHRTRPERRSGTASTDTLASFIDLTRRHMTPASVIFAKAAWPTPSLTTVVDYHQIDGTPDNQRHRISYKFPITDEFKIWLGNAGEAMEQHEFAQFMEDHAAELTAPYDQEKADFERLFKSTFATPNELIDLARHLEIYANHKVKQGVRLQTGESQLEYKEEHVNGRGEPLTIPGIFMIAVPAFIGGDPVRIPVRLRYRLAGGIKWSYHLYRATEYLREQVQADMSKAAEQTGLPAYEGQPEVSA